ncbi:condensation protein [Candidatus Gracilibacteria bacterium]|nr:condensation protein [Candidatus Gracilibacteria bacterium]
MDNLSKRITALSPEQRKLFELHLKKKNLSSVKTQSIPKREDVSLLPLSFHQQRLWILHQLDPDSPAYNIPIAILLEGVLNVKALEQSLNQIRQRHEVLQTCFKLFEGKPVQEKVIDLVLKLPTIDLRKLSENKQQQLVQNLAKEEAQRPFDISQEPLLRVKLLQLSETRYLMLFTMHHIVSDAWSRGVVIRELVALYEAICSSQPSPLPELPIQYADFAAWQKQWLQGEVLESQLAYWKKQLGGNLPVVNLPTNRPRLELQSFRGSKQSTRFPQSLTEELKFFSQQQKVTLFTTLLAGFYILLNWYTKDDDIVIGTDVANRHLTETEDLIGFFINQLVLRANLSGNPTFQDFLMQVRQITLDAYAHQDLPFDKLVEALNPERKLSRSPLFQIKFVLQNTPIPSLELSALSVSVLDEVDNGTATLDLFIAIIEQKEGMLATVQYNTDLFNVDSIKQLLKDFEMVLNIIIKMPNYRLGEIIDDLNSFNKRQNKLKLEKQKKSRNRNIKNIARKKIIL